MPRLLLVATLAGALLLASACEVGVGVDIDVAENGSGTVAVGVSLDRAAADALGDLANQIDLDDLALAGWEVSGPAREADNLLWLRATKPFGSAAELPSILAEIAGPDVFRGFELRRRAEFAEQTWEMVGHVDPAAAFPELLDTLDFNKGLEERIRNSVGGAGGDALTRGLTMRLDIDLPGELRSGGDAYTWTALDADSAESSVPVRLVATEVNTTARTLRLVGLAASALFVLALLLNLLGWWYIRRHRKRRERALLARADSEQLPAAAGSGAGAAAVGGDELAGEFGPTAEIEAVAGVDDDIDWEALTSAEYEDLSADVPGLDDIEVSGAGASADDWTASLEEPPAADAAGAPGAVAPASPDADSPEPDALGRPEPAGADQLERPATRLFDPAAAVDIPAASPDIAADPDSAEPMAESRFEPAPAPEAAEQPDPETLLEPTEKVERADEPVPAGREGADDEPAPAIPPGPDATADRTPLISRAFGIRTPSRPLVPIRDPYALAEAREPEPTAPAPEGAPTGGDVETPAEAQPVVGTPEEPVETPAEPETPEKSESTDEPESPDQPAAPDEPETRDEPPAVDQAPEGVLEVPETDLAATPPAPAGPPPSRALRLVVIGGWGVLFQPADPAGELLTPFVRQSGSTATPAEIRDAYRLATLGRLTPDQLWEACGLTGDPTWTHGPYTGRMTVSEGAADFIRSLLQRGVEVGCVTNDVSEWSRRLRAWTGFEAVTPWVISSDIGIRKPDPGVFEMLRRASGIPFANCLVIDSDPRTLDAARSLGMSTALFGPRDPGQPAARTAHPAVGDFTDLLRRD